MDLHTIAPKKTSTPIFFILLHWIVMKCDPQIHKHIRPHWEVSLEHGAVVKSISSVCQFVGLQPAVTPLITQTIKEHGLVDVELRQLKWWSMQTPGPLLSKRPNIFLALCGLFPCATAAVRQWLLAGCCSWLAGLTKHLCCCSEPQAEHWPLKPASDY